MSVTQQKNMQREMLKGTEWVSGARVAKNTSSYSDGPVWIFGKIVDVEDRVRVRWDHSGYLKTYIMRDARVAENGKEKILLVTFAEEQYLIQQETARKIRRDNLTRLRDTDWGLLSDAVLAAATKVLDEIKIL